MNKFEDIKRIGQGAYGTAYKARKKETGEYYVIKEYFAIKEKGMSILDCMKEGHILKQLDHPHIVAYRDTFLENGNIHLVMDYCEGGDLRAKIKERKRRHFSENQIVIWLVQMSQAVQYMHVRKFLHRDIKPENVFLTKEGIVKMGDFGVAKKLDSIAEFACTYTGTPIYMSPEIIKKRKYNNKSDVWSLGCVLYELAALRPAFDPDRNHGMMFFELIVRGKYPPPPSHYSSNLKDLIAKMLFLDYRSRPSIREVLKHPLLKEFGPKLSKEIQENHPHSPFKKKSFQDELEKVAPKPPAKPKEPTFQEELARVVPEPPTPVLVPVPVKDKSAEPTPDKQEEKVPDRKPEPKPESKPQVQPERKQDTKPEVHQPVIGPRQHALPAYTPGIGKHHQAGRAIFNRGNRMDKFLHDRKLRNKLVLKNVRKRDRLDGEASLGEASLVPDRPTTPEPDAQKNPPQARVPVEELLQRRQSIIENLDEKRKQLKLAQQIKMKKLAKHIDMEVFPLRRVESAPKLWNDEVDGPSIQVHAPEEDSQPEPVQQKPSFTVGADNPTLQRGLSMGSAKKSFITKLFGASKVNDLSRSGSDTNIAAMFARKMLESQQGKETTKDVQNLLSKLAEDSADGRSSLSPEGSQNSSINLPNMSVAGWEQPHSTFGFDILGEGFANLLEGLETADTSSDEDDESFDEEDMQDTFKLFNIEIEEDIDAAEDLQKRPHTSKR